MKVVVLGGGGFIGGHLVRSLKAMKHEVHAVDIREPSFTSSAADKFIVHDLRDGDFVRQLLSQQYEEVYQLAADMGGAGYIFTGENDATIMHNSAQINLNVAEALKGSKSKLFYASSACIYPTANQMDPSNPNCAEDTAYPANPDSEYGWEKLFSERLYLTYQRIHGLQVRIARFHNIYGEETYFEGGREKAPAAICRKVASAKQGDEIEIWGSGLQTRSFLYIDECLEGIHRLMASSCQEVLNIGSDEMVSINALAKMVIEISGKEIGIKNIDGPIGVNGRTSDNQKIQQVLGWQPNAPLRQGMESLYHWVESQLS